MREVIHKYADRQMDERLWKQLRDAIRTKLRDRACEFQESDIQEFIESYGTVDNPVNSPIACFWCNHFDSSVSVRVMSGFPNGTPCCNRCFLKRG